jgi:hypothetical protein
MTLIKSLSFIIFIILPFNSIKSQNTEVETDKIFQVVSQWKKEVLKAGTYVEICPTKEEFDSFIDDNTKHEKLTNAIILPEDFTVSFGYFNGDSKKDALFSYRKATCYNNSIGRVTANSKNPNGGFLLVTSNYDGYKITNEKIDLDKVIAALYTKLQLIQVSISLTEIGGQGIVSGTCKGWASVNDGGKGLCCPDVLYFITIDTNQNKIWLHISDEYWNDSLITFSY